MAHQASALKLALLSVFFTVSAAHADVLDQWIQAQSTYSKQAMLNNIGPSAAVPNAAIGAVVASPSHDPDYRAFWVRDAALTMDTVLSLYERSQSDADKAHYMGLLQDYVDFSRRNQLTPNPSGDATGLGLGEPKFNIDGSAYQSPWGRPQNDGPALRAITLMRFAHTLLGLGRVDYVKQKLYDSSIPANTVIKADLEFVSHHWQDPSFDLWEEVKGDHFYTRMVQRRALLDGADLAQLENDNGAADWYRSQAALLETALVRHWDAGRGYLTVTLNRVGGLDYKSSGLDVAIILGALHATPHTGTDTFMSVNDDRILASAEKIAASFRQVFPINGRDRDWEGATLLPGIGRYPEDHYSGTSGSQLGNPWFLGTNAFAELYYRCAKAWELQGSITVTPTNVTLFRRLKTSSRGISIQAGESIPSSDPRFFTLIRALREEGDGYLRRTRFHADSSGALSEQFNRDTGFMQSAAELTWSHASLLTATWARGN